MNQLLGKQPYNFIENAKKTVSDLNKDVVLQFARARSATYRVLQKDDAVWNNVVKTPKKVIKFVFTEKILQGEDEAVSKISARQLDELEKEAI